MGPWLLLWLAVPVQAITPMPLTVLDPAETDGGLCLDGSPPGYYFAPGSDSNSWLLYMQGGAWCTSPADCLGRSTGHLGSSTAFAPQLGYGGMMDQDPLANPVFSKFNRAILAYCDGGSFVGDAAEPLVPAGSNATLYFRGRRVLRALLRHLVQHRGLGAASQGTEVLLGGGSAGGLAAVLAADWVGALLQGWGLRLRKFRALPVSGFFLDHPVDPGDTLAFGLQMQQMCALHNCTVSPDCARNLSAGERWRCVLANYSYAAARTPMFLLQSSADLYQLFAIARLGGWDSGCLNRGIQFANCSASQLSQVVEYQQSFMSTLRASPKFGRAGEGGFVTSCLEHVAAQSSAPFNNYSIGGQSERRALERWWLADGTEPAAEHWSLPCTLSRGVPHQCNPTCFVLA